MSSSEINFTVFNIPIAQPRQRHRIVKTKGSSFVQNYTPAKHPVNDYKAALKVAASIAHKGPMLEGPLLMNIVFVMPRPKGKVWKRKPMPRYPLEGKPDRDNLMKSTQDALEGILFKNDSQICDGRVRKVVASGDETPHVEIELKTLGK